MPNYPDEWYESPDGEIENVTNLLKYSAEISAAWHSVVELCGMRHRRLQFRAEVTPDKKRVYAKFFDYKTGQVFGASDEVYKIALAICRAFLKANGIEYVEVP